MRTALLLGDEGMSRLTHARVAVFGVGGVGGYVCEALARSGVGALDLFDHDSVSVSNINRQIIALHSTVGMDKVDVMAARLRDVNPNLQITGHALFYLPETADQVDLTRYDYVVDCIDTVTAKMELITRCHAAGVPIICAMGAANKLDPTKLRVADIYKTEGDALARVIRKACRQRGVEHLKVVYSTEESRHVSVPGAQAEGTPRRDTPASAIFVPAAMGLTIASVVVRDLANVD